MSRSMSWSAPRTLTVLRLAVGAVGILILDAAGISFPFFPPPGFLILAAGAVVVAFVRGRWTPLVATAIGLFLIVGFLASGGLDNLTGKAVAPISATGAMIGSLVQMSGVVVAFVSSIVAVASGRTRQPAVRVAE